GRTPTPLPATAIQVTKREILIKSSSWEARFSNKGAVAVSWILKKERKTDGTDRPLLGADGNPLELIPQEDLSVAGSPFSLRVPSSPDLTSRANEVNYQIQGISPDQETIDLDKGESKQITFKYASPDLTVTKTFTFHA